jgi:hypothetical protein
LLNYNPTKNTVSSIMQQQALRNTSSTSYQQLALDNTHPQTSTFSSSLQKQSMFMLELLRD